MSPTPIRVAVFVDWQNTYKAAREAFGWFDWPNEHGNYSPYRLARRLSHANGRDDRGELVRLNVHRGLPSPKYDPEGYAANRRQSAAWMAENPDIVIPRLRPLRYSRDESEPPREKGVDVEIAIASLEWTIAEKCDVAIIFSHDTDLVPAIEAMIRLRGRDCVETASWVSPRFNRRLRTKPEVFHHGIDETTFKTVETLVNYAHSR
jgi:uncharacterized LabA/DUF88 family protein